MRFLIASDLHGSKKASEKLVSLDQKYNFDKIVLLGDIGYSGARNIPPSDYSPIEVYKNLALIKDKLIVISGNCDSRVDETVLGIKFDLIKEIMVDDYKLIFTHGDIYNLDNLKLSKNDILFYGHTHVYELKKINDYYVCNPGSTSLPKINKEKTYVIADFSKKELDLYTLNDEHLAHLKLY